VSDLTKIKAFIFDVDGVLTGGEIVYTNGGEEAKVFNIKDGWAIVEVKKHGFVTGIITGRSSELVTKRATELKIDFLVQGELKKLESYEKFKAQYGIKDEEIAYIGDDLIDLPILVRCGFAVCPADANDEVKSRVHLISNFIGGKGAARQMIEEVLKAKGLWKQIVEDYTR
jgi:3-deoxy-D-manno-octulosonate 8-phosphate phosphatase (KDO 8-P phosphatase)